MAQFFQYITFLIIVIAAYILLDNIFQLFNKRKFKIRLKEDTEDVIKGDSFYNKYKSINSYKNYLASLIREGNVNNITPEKIIKKQIIQSIIVILVFVIVVEYMQETLLYLVALLFLVTIFRQPIKTLKNFERNTSSRIKGEVFEYLIHFFMLLRNYPYNLATVKSLDYAGENLKPHVLEVIAALSIEPGNFKPFHDFAERVNSRELKEFAYTLEQVTKIDKQTATEIMQDQLTIMQELQEEHYKVMVVEKPQQSERLINFMLFSFIVVVASTLLAIIGSTTNF